MKWLKNLFKSPYSSHEYWLYVKCDHCQEILKARVDLYNHLSIQYGEQITYYCRKVIIGGNRCYKQIEIDMTFDSKRKLLDRKINGGEFVSKDEYLISLEN
jgi:hypothetical protein